MDRISQQIEEASRRAASAAATTKTSAIARRETVSAFAAPSSSARLPDGQPLELNSDDLSLREELVINGGQSQFAEVYRLMRTRVLQKMQQNNWFSLGVTSPNPKAGKTTTSLNLSLAIARDPGFRSVLLECDFRRPSAHRSLSLEPEVGLIEYLQCEAELTDILYSDGSPNWRFLPAGPVPYEVPSELFNSNRMRELLQVIRQEQDDTIAIVDLPPSSVGDDVLALSVELDALLLVVEDGVTDERELQNALDSLAENNILGVVLNKAEEAANFVYSYYD